MSSNLYASVSEMKLLLEENWTLSSVPDISFMWEEKSTGFLDDRREFILLTPTNEDPEYFGLYGSDFLHHVFVKIDVHSFQNLEHHENIVNEVFRIVKGSIRSLNNTYVDLLVVNSIHDNDLYRNIYRHSIIVKFRKLNP